MNLGLKSFGLLFYLLLPISTIGQQVSKTQPERINPSATKKKPAGSKISQPKTKAALLFKKVTEQESVPEKKLQVFENYLKKQLKKGSASQADVFKLLGKPDHDLDRPNRDKVTLCQYILTIEEVIPNLPRLHYMQPGTYLWVEFSKESPSQLKDLLLQNLGASYGVCGYCPHVFSQDELGDWRLEGKMLAGCVGANNNGWDILTLPRAKHNIESGLVAIQMANLNEEIEYLQEIELTAVPIKSGHRLTGTIDKNAVVWKPNQEFKVQLGQPKSISEGNDVLVIEVRNNLAMELGYRRHFLHGEPSPTSPELEIVFDREESVKLNPVGSKFLQQVLVKIPNQGFKEVEIRDSSGYWEVRRGWFGSLEIDSNEIEWIKPINQKSIILEQNESVIYEFLTEKPKAEHAVRLRGHYEFLGVKK